MGFTKPIERLSRCRGIFVTEDTIPLSERNKEYLLTLQKLLYEVEIKNEIGKYNKELHQAKEQLTNMVPYRALAGFFANAGEIVNWESVKRLTAYIELFNRNITSLPYTLGNGSRLTKEVYFHPDWVRMIHDNTVSILGWIQYEK